jgi:DNA polymerase-3 subunit beta
MKFTCDQEKLNENIGLVNRAVPTRATHPILTNILIVADKIHTVNLVNGLRSRYRY